MLLLDEPLSALDLRLRQHMRTELRAIQRRVGVTFIYITHDQGEALTMSDRVAVMNHGVVEQVGDGREVYDRPATPFVASFVGENNGISGRVARVADGLAEIETPLGALKGRDGGGLEPGVAATLFIRPERLRPDAEGVKAQVTASAFEGHLTHVQLATPPTATSSSCRLGRDLGAHLLTPGMEINVGFPPAGAVVLPLARDEQRLYRLSDLPRPARGRARIRRHGDGRAHSRRRRRRARLLRAQRLAGRPFSSSSPSASGRW